MTRHTSTIAAILVLGVACAQGAAAQAKFTGTPNGANTSSKNAGTGNAGDSTTQVGTAPAAPRHKRVRVRQAASAASGAQ